jgi:hypothetical protein
MKMGPILPPPRRKGNRDMRNRNTRCLWWLLLTVVLDVTQFGFFDCSGLPILSLLFGVPTFGAIVGVPLLCHAILSDSYRSMGRRVGMCTMVVFLGAAMAIPAGFLMLFTHICP